MERNSDKQDNTSSRADCALWVKTRVILRELEDDRVYPEFCVNVLRECKQQKLV